MEFFFLFKRFIEVEDFLPDVYPIKLSLIDIYKVNKIANSIECIPVEAFEFKGVFLPLEIGKPEQATVFPLLTESHE